MRKEIDILLKAAAKGCIVVERDTNLVWEEGELRKAAAALRFQQPDDLATPADGLEVSAPYPCCIHGGGGTARAIGQTAHFAIFQDGAN